MFFSIRQGWIAGQHRWFRVIAAYTHAKSPALTCPRVNGKRDDGSIMERRPRRLSLQPASCLRWWALLFIIHYLIGTSVLSCYCCAVTTTYEILCAWLELQTHRLQDAAPTLFGGSKLDDVCYFIIWASVVGLFLGYLKVGWLRKSLFCFPVSPFPFSRGRWFRRFRSQVISLCFVLLPMTSSCSLWCNAQPLELIIKMPVTYVATGIGSSHDLPDPRLSCLDSNFSWLINARCLYRITWNFFSQVVIPT